MYTKINETGYADALMREAEGLGLLRDALEVAGVADVRVPEVDSVSEERMKMTAINPQRQTDRVLATLGEGLARIHNLPQARYGFARDNYIGLNPQKNIETDNWGEFFVAYRLGYQVSLIRDTAVRKKFESVLGAQRQTLVNWLNQYCAGPSLLHGDLWSGNVMFEEDIAWLIDPAVYFGDSEADLAMTEMFGGFGPAFYDAYRADRPLSDEYGKKREVYNLYHFLNHYNLFGGRYLEPCEKGFEVLARTFDP